MPVLTRLRFIAIAGAIVRAWHRWKAAQFTEHLQRAFPDTQGGGMKGRTLEQLIEPCQFRLEETITANRLDD
eukprot:844046-Pyramimonas_sp.AAC.1